MRKKNSRDVISSALVRCESAIVRKVLTTVIDEMSSLRTGSEWSEYGELSLTIH